MEDTLAVPACPHASLSNTDVIVAALLSLGGDTKQTDIEHIAMKCHELSPGRLSWHHYPEQVNLEAVFKALWSLQKTNPPLVLGSKAKGWILTKDGILSASRTLSLIQKKPSAAKGLKAQDRGRRERQRERLESLSAFEKAIGGRPDEITKREAEVFFRFSQYTKKNERKSRIQRLLNLFLDDDLMIREAILAVGKRLEDLENNEAKD